MTLRFPLSCTKRRFSMYYTPEVVSFRQRLERTSEVEVEKNWEMWDWTYFSELGLRLRHRGRFGGG